jgi:exodeoxyribonuclease VII large subunit
VSNKAEAEAAGALTLHFVDGVVDARVEKRGGATYEKAKREQPRLL